MSTFDRVIEVVAIALLAIACVMVGMSLGHAKDFQNWEGKPYTAWFNAQMQPDTGISCCGLGDGVEADDYTQTDHGTYLATITDGKGLVDDGTIVEIPNNKILLHSGNPTGHGIVWIGWSEDEETGERYGPMRVYCYAPPTGL